MTAAQPQRLREVLPLLRVAGQYATPLRWARRSLRARCCTRPVWRYPTGPTWGGEAA